MTIIGTAHNKDDRQTPLYKAVSAAYDRWTTMPQPASHILEGRIARGRVMVGTWPESKPGRDEAVQLLAQLRDQLKLARWAEGVEGSDEWCVLAAWEAARVEYEAREDEYLRALGGHRVQGDLAL